MVEHIMTPWKFLKLWCSLTLRWHYFKVHCYFTNHKEKKFCQLSYHKIFLIIYILTFYLRILLILEFFSKPVMLFLKLILFIILLWNSWGFCTTNRYHISSSNCPYIEMFRMLKCTLASFAIRDIYKVTHVLTMIPLS